MTKAQMLWMVGRAGVQDRMGLLPRWWDTHARATYLEMVYKREWETSPRGTTDGCH